MITEIFKQVNIDFYDERRGCKCVTGWKTNSPDEEATIIARVYSMSNVQYTNQEFRNDSKVRNAVDKLRYQCMFNS